MKMLKAVIFLPFMLFAQDSKESFRDTSYTIYSAFEKLHKDYPFIEIAAPDLNEKITLMKDIIYYSVNGRDLRLDLFTASNNEKKCPAVILIHGGGWRSGNKSMQHPLALYLAQNNYVAAAVEYRLSPQAKYPAAIIDLKNAVKWIRKNASGYNIDENKIAVLGCSAGGTLAALLGTTNGNKIFEDTAENQENLSIVQAVVNIDGIVDFTHPAESGKDNDPSKPSAGKFWFGESFKENPKLWEEASPVNYVNEKTPPVVFINSSDDRFHAGRDEMTEKLEIFNIYYEVHTIKNSPHTFWLFHPWFERTAGLSVKFLDKIFNR